MIELGQTLGLERMALKRCGPQSLVGDLVERWIRRDHHVLEMSGDPTWRSLAKALKDIKMTGISMDIQNNFNFSL